MTCLKNSYICTQDSTLFGFMRTKKTFRMQKNTFLCCLMMAMSFLCACEEDTLNVIYPLTPYPLPVPADTSVTLCDTLRILAIGNSYSADGTAYISEILDNAGVDSTKYCVYLLTRGNTDLKYWSEELSSGEKHLLYRTAGDLRMPILRSTVDSLLMQNWDVVVLQQFSVYATDYSTFNPYLGQLVKAVKTHCTNPQVSLAWQLIHAYGQRSSLNGKLFGDDRWTSIAFLSQLVMHNDSINMLIPTGTAIQIARHTSLQTPYDLTRDNSHLAYGVGRYIAACTWVQTFFVPVYQFSLLDVTANHSLLEIELNDGEQGFIEGSSVPVTEENRGMCQRCAIKACRDPFDISVSDFIYGFDE